MEESNPNLDGKTDESTNDISVEEGHDTFSNTMLWISQQFFAGLFKE